MNQTKRSLPRFSTRGALLALPAALWLIVFFVIPLLIVLVVSFHTRGLRGKIHLPWTTENYTYVTGAIYGPIFERSFLIAFYTTIICLAIGYPLAFYITTRRRAAIRNFMLFLVILPFWTNFLVRTYAWRVLLAKEGILNTILLQLHLITEPLQILLTRDAVIIGMVYGYLPYMVLPIYASLARFNYRLVQAGYDLGGNDWVVFRRILLPLTMPGVIAGCILVFIPSIGAFVTPDMLGGTQGRMIGNLIERNFRGTGHWPRGAAASMVLIGVVAIGMLLYLALVEGRMYGTPSATTRRRTLRRKMASLMPMLSIAMVIGQHTNAALERISEWRLRLWIPDQWRLRRDYALRYIGQVALLLVPIASYIFLWVPIAVLIVFSFNDSRSIATWHGFTTQWYDNIIHNTVGSDTKFSTALMLQSLTNSLRIALPATLIATILGTLTAISLVRGAYIGKRWLQGLLYLPVAIPEIAFGVSLLIFFNRSFNYINGYLGERHSLTFGFTTMIIAHVTFSISYVAIVVSARLANMSKFLEEAAQDLGANNWRTFWRVTFPLALPGIIAGALLVFTMSLDDYVISFFTSGIGTTTLTMYVYGLLKLTITPEINAMSTLMIVISAVLISISLFLQRRDSRPD